MQSKYGVGAFRWSLLRYDKNLMYLSQSLSYQNVQVSNCIEKDISILFQTHYRSSACIPWPGEFLQLQPWWHAATPGHQCQETGGRSQKSTTSQHQQQQWRVGQFNPNYCQAQAQTKHRSNPLVPITHLKL